MFRPVTLDARLSELIGHLYDAAVDDRLWTGIAARIASAFGSSSAVVKLHDGDANVHMLESTDNLAVADHRRAWAEHWHRRDLWVERSVAFGMSRIVTDHDLVTEAEQRESGYYQEWLRELGIHHMVGAVFPATNGTIGVLGIHRPQADGYYDDADRQKVALFLPHLQRALRLGEHLASTSLARMAALDALDRLDTGVLVVDRSCRIIHANAQAEDILASSGEIGVLNGRLFARCPAIHGRLLSLAHDNVETAAGRISQPGMALAIPRDGRLPLTLAAAPLPTMATRYAHPHPMALIFLRDPENPTLSTHRLRHLFGLTRTEAAVAADLGGGHSLDEIARRHGVGLATVRSHLKQILSKTGTQRQAEAVALITRSVASLPDRSN